jgi:hypothetical protein
MSFLILLLRIPLNVLYLSRDLGRLLRRIAGPTRRRRRW